MKKTLFASLALAALFASASASAQVSYPGNTWGTLVYGVKTPEGDTVPQWRAEGIIEQGIVWKQFQNGWKLNTFGALEYVINSDDSGYTPVLGVKMQKSFGGDGALDLGVRYKYGNTYLSPTGNGSFAGGTQKVGRVEVYATYWFAWDMKR